MGRWSSVLSGHRGVEKSVTIFMGTLLAYLYSRIFFILATTSRLINGAVPGIGEVAGTVKEEN